MSNFFIFKGAPNALMLPIPDMTSSNTGTFRDSESVQSMWFSVFPDQSAYPSLIYLTGIFEEVANNVNSDYVTAFGVGNNHISILIKSITTGGIITIKGTSLSEETAVPVPLDTEDIVVDTTLNQYYQTHKKWLEITKIDVSNTTGIVYDIVNLGYSDIGNRDFTINGYRIEAHARGNACDLRFVIEKIQDDGFGKMSIIKLEDIKIDNNVNGIIDNLRVAPNSRSYTMSGGVGSEIWKDGSTMVLKQGDFDTYFTLNKNRILSSSKDEGVIIKIIGDPLGAPQGTDYVRIQIRYYQN